MVIIVFGVSGCGKTTIGKSLSTKLGVPFYDADDYHPQYNIDKMSNGQSLDDHDRQPWLERLAKLLNENNDCVLACSALKEKYRQILSQGSKNIEWVHLHGRIDLISDRIKSRDNHFMKASMLKSQFDTLEDAQYGQHIDIEFSPDEIIDIIIKNIKPYNDMNKTSFGVIGLGVMGKSISLNIAEKGHSLSVYNRADAGEENIVSDFMAQSKFENIQGYTDLKEFVDSMSVPRKILMMIKAGPVVDYVLKNLIPFLSAGDTVIDGGNSHYEDTRKRHAVMASHDIHFIGSGVSGGEEGARRGPSIMPGGTRESYEIVAPVLESIAAKDINGNPCCSYIGPDGAGHFVKMIHNGIEYAEMELLAETYALLKDQMTYEEISDLLESWNSKEHASYLLEITIDILRKKEEGKYILDIILDKAGNKGTGSWSSKAALDLGVANTLMADAVFARYISSFKSTRVALTSRLGEVEREDAQLDAEVLSEAYKFVRLINHHQGFEVMREASKTYDWSLDLSKIASIWTNGCIIRSAFMHDAIDRFKREDNLMAHDDILSELKGLESSVQIVIAHSLVTRTAIPVISSAYQYWIAMTTDRLPANMIQAQRDYFGAHTYKRIDKDENESFHTVW